MIKNILLWGVGSVVAILASCTGADTDYGYTVEQNMALADCQYPKYERASGEDCPVWISAEERADRTLRWVVLGHCERADRPETWRCTASTCVR